MRPTSLQQDAREDVHPRRERVKVVNRLKKPILEIRRIAQPHPIEAEVESQTEREEDQAAQHERNRHQGVFTPAWPPGPDLCAHALVDCSSTQPFMRPAEAGHYGRGG